MGVASERGQERRAKGLARAAEAREAGLAKARAAHERNGHGGGAGPLPRRLRHVHEACLPHHERLAEHAIGA
jgi:hypothetical protein